MKPFFTLSSVFADHMVFQSGKPVRLFGTCRKKVELKVDWKGEQIKYRTEGTTFLIELPSLPVTKTPFSFAVSCKKQVVEIRDCLAGDVILCGGQSNMQFTVKDTVFETRPKPNRNIRFYEVPKLPYDNAHVEFPWLYQSHPKWVECDKDSALWFSAIGYYVSQSLQEELDVPIGVISCNNGDTSVFTWTAMADLSDNPALARYLAAYRTELAKYPKADDYDRLFKERLPKLMEFWGEIEKGVAAGLSGEEANRQAYEKVGDSTLPMGPKHWNRPAGEFDTMLRTVVPFTIKAVLFYQGESDHQNADLYEQAFKTMIRSWRRVFDDATLPFVFTQVAGYSYPGLPEPGIALVREAQAACINLVDNVFMASAVDLGEENNIHPKDKRIVAQRLLDVLLEKVYRKGKNSLSPALFSYQYAEGKLVVYTQYNAMNLVSRSGQNLGFTVLFENGCEFEAEKVELTGNQIIVRNIKHAVEVRHNFKNFPHCDIYSANELPLLPFRIKLKY
ncbi:MAG: sialate O-acetylesterase [Candidatus Izemoplasmatales bacterium]